MPKPIIFLAFANDKVDNARYLRNLPAELAGIRDALQKATRTGLCEVVERANVTAKQLLDTFQEHGDRIAVFHYGGHADGYQLLLETLLVVENPNSGFVNGSEKRLLGSATTNSVSVAHGEGLVSFLSKQKGLQLIFFNGCSTAQQAQELANAGIPAVIGTHNAINDEVATDLAIRFYNGIAEQKTIAQAYAEAIDEIKLKKGGNVRGLYRKEEKEVPDKLPWEVFYNPQKGEKVKNWKLKKSQRPLILGVLAVLLLLAAYPLYKLIFPDLPFNFTVKVKEITLNPNLPFESGKISLQIGDKTETLDLDKNKEVIFKQIPPNLEKQSVKMTLEAEGFVKIDSMIVLENNFAEIGIRRDESLAKIFGMVKDSNNQPIDSVKISLQNFSVYSNETGKFELKIPFDKQNKKQRLTAFKKGYEFWDYETPVNGVEVKIILNR